ncbi:NACHT domain-containing NTPase [Streptomyces sp. WAC06614]|uniref:NACHT domain-containing protein n=1 Tax=Streptomyces sp. WAC06614 TaxID=2487416 RepID=UPI000F78E784|nr:NACHT domain-containing protein [Streptomyces sp. WAC06614]RSS64784.1 NACHT domain-containing protein [Streptomyces sp. WAC06614]
MDGSYGHQEIRDVRARKVIQKQYFFPGGEEPVDTDRAARELRTTVRTRLQDEIARLQLEHPDPIPVRWSPSGQPVQPSLEALGIEDWSVLHGDVTQVPEFLRKLPRHQLVVLGEPGSGKSVLALLLAWNLLKRWRPGDEVPVLMPLSSWRPTVPLRAWMVRYVRELGLGPDRARALFDENQVMPVLDGLDELPPDLHARAVAEIDAAVADGRPLLVTCRVQEYRTAVREQGRHLTKAACVELDSLTPDEAIAYLRRSAVAGETRWDPLYAELRERPGTALAATLSSPLMLHLARTAYRSPATDPAELLTEDLAGDRAKIESHLLAQYLPATFAPPAARRFRADRARRYLTTLARQMGRDGTHEFAWWQIDSPVTAVVVALAFGCSYGWFLTLLFGAWKGVFAGLLTGTTGFFVHLWVRERQQHVHVTEDVVRGPRGVLRQYAALAWLSALLVGALTGAAVGGWLSTVLDEAPRRPVLGFSLFVGAAAAFATLVSSAWGSYHVSRGWLSLTRRLPWRFWTFVDTAHGLGVLRQTGAAHQFRHLRVQEQLSGSTRPSSRSVYSGRRTAAGWKLLLPALPTAAQTLVALVWLVLTGAISLGNGIGEDLRYRSGDRPQVNVDFCESACATNATTWTWHLPPGGSRRTVTELDETDGAAVAQWNGGVSSHGCPGSRIEVTLQLGEHPPVSFVQRPDGLEPMDAKAPLPKPLPLADEPVTITLRRADGEPCEASLSWVGAGVRRDGMEPVRKRFGVSGP